MSEFILDRYTDSLDFIGVVVLPATSRKMAYTYMVKHVAPELCDKVLHEHNLPKTKLIKGNHTLSGKEIYAIVNDVNGEIFERWDIVEIADGLLVDAVWANHDTVNACRELGYMNAAN